jgi:4-diphosphocytidyl-2C-methyl-D-erythritol kinase
VTLRLRAHAKINLALAVGPPDISGMHAIASWMAPIDLADDIELTRLPDGIPPIVEVQWASGEPIDWPIERDLTYRAPRRP